MSVWKCKLHHNQWFSYHDIPWNQYTAVPLNTTEMVKLPGHRLYYKLLCNRYELSSWDQSYFLRLGTVPPQRFHTVVFTGWGILTITTKLIYLCEISVLPISDSQTMHLHAEWFYYVKICLCLIACLSCCQWPGASSSRKTPLSAEGPRAAFEGAGGQRQWQRGPTQHRGLYIRGRLHRARAVSHSGGGASVKWGPPSGQVLLRLHRVCANSHPSRGHSFQLPGPRQCPRLSQPARGARHGKSRGQSTRHCRRKW